VLQSSATYDTEPVGDVLDQPEFLNCCLKIETEHDPEDLLAACKAVERELGRPAVHPHHGPRAIDVDVLLLGGSVYRSERLALPHAELEHRRFVLVPLLELDGGLALPDGRLLARARAGLGPGQEVRRAGPPLALGAGQAGAGDPVSQSAGSTPAGT
jgi:2-amino-4-hydroxy-6-hydroxymethyldihydropteridine diphosphokinase